MQSLYIREAKRLQRQMEFSQTSEEIQHGTGYAFTTVRFPGEYCLRVLLEQYNQPQNSGEEPSRFLSERREHQSRQREPCQILRQECLSQKIRYHVEMDAQTAY